MHDLHGTAPSTKLIQLSISNFQLVESHAIPELLYIDNTLQAYLQIKFPLAQTLDGCHRLLPVHL